MSPDPSGPWVAYVFDPQSWNFYAYARNNPLTNTDPDGQTCQTNSSDGNVYDDMDGNGCSTVDQQDAQRLQNGDYDANAWGNFGSVGTSSSGTGNLAQQGLNAPSKPGLFTCAATFADKYSIAGGLNSLGIGNSGVSGFVTNTLGGNAFSGATHLMSSLGSGTAGGHSVFYNMGQSLMAGPLQGIPGGSGPWGASVSDLATGGIVGGAFSAVTGAGQTLQGLNGAASLASTGIDAAEVASGVGILKFAYDLASYSAGLAHCY